MTALTIFAVIALSSILSIFIIDVMVGYFTGCGYRDEVTFAFFGAVLMFAFCIMYVLTHF